MRRHALSFALPLLVVAAPAFAEGGLSVQMPEGFEVAREAVDPFSKRRMVEHVPAGQTVWDWTDKITVQTLPKTRAPAGYAASVANTFAGGCDGSETSVLFEGVVKGAEAATILATCPASPQTGTPVAFMLKAVDGGETIHVVEWTWNGALPTEAQRIEAAQFLDTVALCDDATATCPSS
jgi:hypothetical protein